MAVADGEAAAVAAVGIAGGVLLAWSAARYVRSLLFDITPADPLSFAISLVLLSGVALLASYIPARRATKVDPMVALRYE